MIIAVTTEDIRQGVPKHASCCPVARAIQRACPGRMVEVLNGGIVTIDGYALELPEEVVAFVQNFDMGLPTGVAPFEFELEV